MGTSTLSLVCYRALKVTLPNGSIMFDFTEIEMANSS